MTENIHNDRVDYGRLPPRYRMPAGIDDAAMPALLEAWRSGALALLDSGLLCTFKPNVVAAVRKSIGSDDPSVFWQEVRKSLSERDNGERGG